MKTALLVVDMQRFFGEILETPLPKVKMLNDFFNETSRTVIFTQHGHTKDELVPPIKNQIIRVSGASEIIMVDTEAWELHPEISKMAQTATVVKKNTYDAFQGTRLYSILRAGGIGRLIICGVLSDYCCNTTARSAFCKDFETWFVSDACWAESAEQHDRTVKDMQTVLGKVHTAAEALARLMEEKK